MSLHDKQGRELNDDGTRVGGYLVPVAKRLRTCMAMSRKFEAESPGTKTKD